MGEYGTIPPPGPGGDPNRRPRSQRAHRSGSLSLLLMFVNFQIQIKQFTPALHTSNFEI